MTTIGVQRGEALKRQFVLDPSFSTLSADRQEQIFARCLHHYQQAMASYEMAASRMAFEHPSAQEFARELCQRMADIVVAHSDILDEEHSPARQHPLVSTQEFRRKQRLSQVFGNVSTNPGSVGMNPLAIEGAIRNGNLRERMTLIYSTIFSFLINEVLDKPGMIDKINERLANLPSGRRFQIDKTLCELEKRERTGIITLPKLGKLVRQCPIVDLFRNVEMGRVPMPKRAPGSGPCGPTACLVSNLSEREALVGTRFAALSFAALPPRQRLEWIPGKEWYTVSPSCTFARETASLAQTSLTGPSGTADGILHLAKYLGMGDRGDDALLAFIGWMVPVGDHSLHEVRAGASYHGREYTGMPEEFTKLYSPKVVERINALLECHGYRNPSCYFTKEFQREALQEIREEELRIEWEIEAELGLVSEPVEVNDLIDLNEPQEILLHLAALNQDMRKIEAAKNRLEQMMDGASGYKLEAMRQKRNSLIDKYNLCMDEKILVIQTKVQPENRVYAMAVPRFLKRGTPVCTSGTREQMNRLLYTKGFSAGAAPTKPAFLPDSGNELGSAGHYFSTMPPAEKRGEEVVIGCVLDRDLEGAAIMSVPELLARGFSAEQIEQGYKKLQTDYSFLQRDGLPPKDSSIVILRPEGNWSVVEWMPKAEPDSRRYSTADLHATWRSGVAASPLAATPLAAPVAAPEEVAATEEVSGIVDEPVGTELALRSIEVTS